MENETLLPEAPLKQDPNAEQAAEDAAFTEMSRRIRARLKTMPAIDKVRLADGSTMVIVEREQGTRIAYKAEDTAEESQP
jgi:hypothetical protein